MLIHKMRLDDNMAVLDINSGCIHLVDEVTYEVLPIYSIIMMAATMLRLWLL